MTEPTESNQLQPGQIGATHPTVAFDEAATAVREAHERRVPLKLIGGQAVRLLCPLFPLRARTDQDMDFASVSSAKRAVMDFFAERGFVPDARFNLLHGDRQMYFTTADGKTSVDVIMDRLNMCHILDFRDRIDRMPHTLDVTDLLLTKLQIVELNRKDLHDIVHLLSAYEVRDGDDVISIGGGSAGSALANRLSSEPSNRVLVLEAGRPDYPWDVFIQMPAALTFPIGSRFYDWKYESEPEPFMRGRRIYHARGKVLGGSSSINGMIFQRGSPLDYERWAADPGMDDWDYAHCLPYFKKMENCLAAAPDDVWRGHDGPLKLERGPARSPLFQAFFQAVQQAGY